MNLHSALESTSALERLVLDELARLAERGRTPTQAPTLLQRCRDRFETADDVLVGRCTEAVVASSCLALAERGLVTSVAADEGSWTGMGRPGYELVVDPGEVRAFVNEEDGLHPRRGDRVLA